MISDFLLVKFTERLQKLKQSGVGAKIHLSQSQEKKQQRVTCIQTTKQKKVSQLKHKNISDAQSLNGNDSLALNIRTYNQQAHLLQTCFSNQCDQLPKSQNQQLKSDSYSQNIPAYALNNLMYISRHVPSHILKLYIQEVSKKHRIQFNTILTSFLIQQGLNIFFQMHDISFSFNDHYISIQLEQALPSLLEKFHISDWKILKDVAKGIFNRFKIKVGFDQRWLINILVKNKRQLREGLVKVEVMLRAAKGLGEEKYTQEPTQLEKVYVNYKGLKDFLSQSEKTKELIKNLQSSNDEKIAESSVKQGISTNLNYFHILMMKSKEAQRQRNNAIQSSNINKRKREITQKRKQVNHFEDQILVDRESNEEIFIKSKKNYRKITKKQGKIADKQKSKQRYFRGGDPTKQ